MTSGSGKSTLRFKRALVNSGKTVLTLTGKNAMLWAFGSSSSLGNHGGNRGSFSINFVTGAVTDMSSGADARAVARLAHGILALLGKTRATRKSLGRTLYGSRTCGAHALRVTLFPRPLSAWCVFVPAGVATAVFGRAAGVNW